MRRLCLCLFNRATYGRSKSLIQAISKSEDLHLTVVLSASLLEEEYGNAQEYIKDDSPNVRYIGIPLENKDRSHFGSCIRASEILAKMAIHISCEKYDAAILIADRFETIAAAQAFSFQNIPIIHIQGGEVTGNIDEKIRHAVTKLSDYHFAPTKLAKDYIIEMGEHPNRVYNTGDLAIDLCKGVRGRRPRKRYFICMYHPETTNPAEIKDNTIALLNAVIDHAAQTQTHCYWYSPNPDPGCEEVAQVLDQAFANHPVFLTRMVNEPPEVFLERLRGSALIVGNSSCGIKESGYMRVPSVNIGIRQGIRERSVNVIDVPFTHRNILKAMRAQHDVHTYPRSYLWGRGKATEEMMRAIKLLDYTRKGPLMYPYTIRYRTRHLLGERFNAHIKKPQKRTPVYTTR